MSRIASSATGPGLNPAAEEEASEVPSQSSSHAPSAKPAPPSNVVIAPPLKEVPDPLRDIDRTLTRTLMDPFISEADRTRVHALLEQLPPSQYRGVLERMERSGSLERYVGDLAPGELARFIHQGVDKGVLQRHTGAPHGPRWNPEGKPFDPPGIPPHFRPDPGSGLPGPVLGAMVRHNNHVIREYDRAYEAYVDRFAQGVREVRDPDSLRQLGEVVKPHPFIEAEPHKGVRRQPSFLDAELAWSRKATHLRGEIPAGATVEVFEEVAYKKKIDGGHVAVKEKGALLLDGDLKVSAKGTVSVTAGVNMRSLPGDIAGIQTTVGPHGELKNVGAFVDTEPVAASATISREGKVELTGAIGHYGAKVIFDPEHNTVAFGPIAKKKVGDFTFTVGELTHFRGLQDHAAERAVNWRREIDPPDELRAGIEWNQLSVDRQLQLRATWSPDEWNRLAARARRSE